jgi:hypothetical protein
MPITNGSPVSASEVIAFTRLRPTEGSTNALETKPYKILPRRQTPVTNSAANITSLLSWRGRPQRISEFGIYLKSDAYFNVVYDGTPYQITQAGVGLTFNHQITPVLDVWDMYSVAIGAKRDNGINGVTQVNFTNLPAGQYKVVFGFTGAADTGVVTNLPPPGISRSYPASEVFNSTGEMIIINVNNDTFSIALQSNTDAQFTVMFMNILRVS